MFVILNFLAVLWLQENYWVNDVELVLSSALTVIICNKSGTPEQHPKYGNVLYY
jgi:hypothetical protein